MASDARMTVRLDAATRRKVERLAKREGVSLNEALNLLLRRAPDEGDPPVRKRRYRLKPRKVGFGFEIATARRPAAQMSDDQALSDLESRD
jgi:antitoxin component of RelBE/YafQ-DinJ toxin-antitoxin module